MVVILPYMKRVIVNYYLMLGLVLIFFLGYELINGKLIDDFDDLNFPNANYHIARIEWENWWNPDTVEKVDEGRVKTHVGAGRRLQELKDYINLFDDGEEPMSGILAKMTPIHTAGHMSVGIEECYNTVLIVGDAINDQYVSLRHLTWLNGLDQNAAKAASRKESLLKHLSSED